MFCKLILILGQFLRIYTSRTLCFNFLDVRTVHSIGSKFVFGTLLERLAIRKPCFDCIIMLYSAAATTFQCKL
jgi:hypothetical protein